MPNSFCISRKTITCSNPQTMLATANERDWKEKWTEQLFDSFITLKKFEEEIEKANGINLAEKKGLVLQGYKNKKKQVEFS